MEEIKSKLDLILEMPRTSITSISVNMAFVKLKIKLHGKKSMIKFLKNPTYPIIVEKDAREYLEQLVDKYDKILEKDFKKYIDNGIREIKKSIKNKI